MRKVQIALFLVLLPSILPRLVHLIPEMYQFDFNVYYTASKLAQGHQGAAIYSGADTGVDPQYKFADPESLFAKEAHKLGLREIKLYLYPPILADALIPLSCIPLPIAVKVWITLNVGALFLIAFMAARQLQIRWFSFGGLTLLIGLFVSQPVISAMSMGQITVVILLLWMWGIRLYERGLIGASAAVFAFATCVKLTPLIVILPFLIWREWKWLRAYLVSMLVFVLIMCILNTPFALIDYLSHVMPSMSRGIPDVGNESILASIQLVDLASQGKTIEPPTTATHGSIVALGKLLSIIPIGISAILLLRVGSIMCMRDRLFTLLLMAMLSASVAPVSWRHAYTVALPALAWLWAKALRNAKLDLQTLLLSLCTIATTSYVTQWSLRYLIRLHLDFAGALITLLLPGSVVLVVSLSLLQMRSATETSAS